MQAHFRANQYPKEYELWSDFNIADLSKSLFRDCEIELSLVRV